jgi:squalene-hopene/tetraprenyl-beta-curcumene cyclase
MTRIRRFARGTALALAAITLFVPSSRSAAQAGPDHAVGESVRKDALHAIQIGVEWLEQNQQENGCWSSPAFPAVTGLAVSAILRSPGATGDAHRGTVTRGLDFILSCVQDDGGIYQHVEGVKGGGLPNYNTAICLMALLDAADPKHDDVVARARAFLINAQHQGEDVFRGGMGYDQEADRPYADLSNTVFALEAVRRTEALEGIREGSNRLDWEGAIAFVSRCQHLRETNDADWVSEASGERGGFVYHPIKSQAGAAESSDGDATYLRSYGSMTYAGLLSFMYADVERDDPRVLAAVDWVTRHWTLDENPGMGPQGLYFNYHTMAKALGAFGQEILVLPGGKTTAWRPALIEKLVVLQRIDPKTGLGYWQNDNNRWWENDANLVTSYTLLALETAITGPQSMVSTQERPEQ